MEPFVSSADLDAFTGTQHNPDAPLTLLALESACDTIRRYIRQQVNYVENDIEYADGSGTRRLILREMPLRSIESVTMDDGEELEAGADYIAYPQESLLVFPWGVWPIGVSNVTVVYSHGWDLTFSPQLDSGDIESPGETASPGAPLLGEYLPVPADLRLVALTLARRVLAGMGAAEGGIKQETIGSYSYTLATASNVGELLLSERAVLDRYRDRRTSG
jgi:hypothetical protein